MVLAVALALLPAAAGFAAGSAGAARPAHAARAALATCARAELGASDDERQRRLSDRRQARLIR